MTHNITHIISPERFATYKKFSKDISCDAQDLYSYNMALSEVFYTPLCVLEVALRNKIDAILQETYGAFWFENTNIITDVKQRLALEGALKKIRYQKNSTPRGKVIAELSFGFWTAMFNRPYNNLWRSTLNKVARTQTGSGVTQADYTRRITQIRKLRNRIMHYEPIIQLNIQHQYENIMTLIEWMSPEAASWVEEQSRFSDIYDADINDKVRQ